ncbi:Flp pilus assembly protein CpaB [Yoonia litorea]|uniref:Pilus assembly protein CpaB n=1 Tax=Yoonia litorea TaxID=1123755 RepID=A0A1I6N297_9RHOB|nr:Flp pilus assembly protein CpaB [Yoonia litorea]SFS21991.1 pilus assembly protein CpaB [Yoonia litorea]
MRALFGLVLLAGMGLAGFAVYMVNQSLEQKDAAIARERERARQIVQTVEIYAPARDITYGELLRAEDVKLVRYAVDDLPEGVYRTEEELFPEGLDTPRVVRVPMYVNEPILSVKVTEAGAPRGLTALLDPGMRAYPLPNGMTNAFIRDLRVADRIDLYWVGEVRGQQTSRLVKSGLEILAIEGRDVTLQVSQTDFADLRILQSAGSLSLTPVALVDAEGGDTTIETNIRDALGLEEIVVAPAPAPEPTPEICTRRERRGVDIVVIQVPCE